MSKKLLRSLAAASFLGGQVLAQNPCDLAISVQLSAPDLTTTIKSNGSLFNAADGQNSHFQPFLSSGNQASAIFNAELWIAGLDPGFNLKGSFQQYPGNKTTGYLPGFLDAATGLPQDCANWNRLFKTTGADIAAHRADWADDGAVQNPLPSILGWPGRGNQQFEAQNGFPMPAANNGFAPFWDENQNGTYEPLEGDFPCVWLRGHEPFVPFEMTWNVFNDVVTNLIKPFFNEIQLTAWTLDCDKPEYRNAVFTSHKIIHRGTEKVDSVSLGLFVDFDLGCYEDDFIGSLPAEHTFFAYNADAIDGSFGNQCAGGVATFSGAPPVQAVTFLSKTSPDPDPGFFENKLDRFIGWSNQNVDATTPGGVYETLNGRWSDGSPIVPNTATGFDPSASASTNWIFPGDIADPTAWSMNNFSVPLADRRALGATNGGAFWPGQVIEFNAAWTTSGGGASIVENYETMKKTVAELQKDSKNNALGQCSAITTATAEADSAAKIRLSPNPATDVLWVDLGGFEAERAEIFDAKGQLLETVFCKNEKGLRLAVGQIPAGVYALKIAGERGAAVKKFVRVD